MKLVLCLHKYGVDLGDPCAYPLGFMYISAVLKEAGHEVKVLNYNLYDYDYQQEITGADAVLFTGFEDFQDRIIRDAGIAHRMGIRTILGGALATFKPEFMEQFVTTVVVGEAEGIIEKALDTTGIVMGQPVDLSELPYPDYDGFGIREYHKRNLVTHMGVLTSRGCPYSCTFCAHTCKFRVRELADVLMEIDYYRSVYNPEYIIFNDNTFNLSVARVESICRFMKSRGLKWSAAIRADRFTRHMAEMMKDSGCAKVIVGVESFNQAKLDRMNKRLRVEQITACLDALNDVGLDYHANVLVGFPSEDMASVVDEVVSIPPQYKVVPATVRPFVGTQWGKTSLSSDELEQLDYVFAGIAKSKGLTYWKS